jgi:hypothetical protein
MSVYGEGGRNGKRVVVVTRTANAAMPSPRDRGTGGGIAQKPGVAGPLDEREYFDPERALKIGLMNGRKARESGLWLKACPSL